jgi:ribosomal protein L29
MDLKELRNQSQERLQELALEARTKIRDLRFTVGTRQRANVRDLRKAKQELARILTLINESSSKSRV